MGKFFELTIIICMTYWVSGLVVFLSVGIYGVIHSWQASFTFKAWAKRSAPNFYEKYFRLLYSTLSVVLLLPIAVLVYSLPDVPLYRIPVPWVFGTVLIQMIALFLVLLAFRGTDTASFLGLRQVIQPSPEPEALQTSGLYRHVRHPIYSLGMMIIWLFPWMTTNLLALFAASTLYLIIGAVFEERKLRVLFAEYQAYQKQVPMFIPKLKK